ncbi:unnamed protein product [Lathyrus oleraceus]|uniref:DUF1639 family protein n=2 Tax=Pisum sativum TaxID=3888 RepID=A0A9D5AB30_PEA|nr:uncharacterized protein LOC127094385 isoform X1 [Pisum sativum]KAI5401436.1 hypothetical protein KIW84_066053 [Pisum sativum]
MVFSGEEEESNMGSGSERGKPLHNFMLPCLKWGTQRHLKCMKIPSDEGSPSRNNATESEKKRSKISEQRFTGDEGIGAVREKLMLDLKTEADRMKDAILRKEKENNGGDEDEVEVEVVASAAAARERTWNLRTRKGVGGGESGKGLLKIDEKKPNVSPSALRNGNSGVKLKGDGDSNEKVKFSLTLTKKEIEEDFMKMVGHRPPRRPKKRPRIVQRQMDTLFPGMWLSEVSADAYKVPDVPEGKK